MNSIIKSIIVANSREYFKNNDLVLVINYNHLDDINYSSLNELKQDVFRFLSGQNEELNMDFLKNNIQFRIIKNTISRKVLNDVGLTKMKTMIHGPIFYIAFKNINSRNLIKTFLLWFKNKKDIFILGGKFKNQLISLKEIDKLSLLEGNNSFEDVYGITQKQIMIPVNEIKNLISLPNFQLTCSMEILLNNNISSNNNNS